MKIGNREIAAGSPPYIIAEIGVNHDGSVDHAIELVQAASQAGANAIKLQLFSAQRLLSRTALLATYQRQAGATDPVSMLSALELSADQMNEVVQAAHSLGLHAIVTVFSVELVDDARRLDVDAFKTASPDIINRPLIDALIATGRPLLLSTGAATLEEVQSATVWLGEHPHLLMQCVSAYPTADEYAALAGRTAMLQISPHALGYSDHTTAVDTGALAVASGACVLEKHLTHDRSAPGPDHAASLDPQGFAEYVRLAHRAHRMLGQAQKTVLEIEQDVRQVARQSLTAARDLPANCTLSLNDITIKRPGLGLSPARLTEIVGRRLATPVPADTPITEEHLA